MVIPFPPYRPTSFELRLPGCPVITNNWRATEWPEILGNIAEGASLRLSYRNITDAEALELLLLWRATAGGRYPLNPLPAEVAAGINDAALADRILNIAPLVWVPAGPPSQESVKRIRSGLEIELVSELRFSPVIALPSVTCPAWAFGGGPPPIPPPEIDLPGVIDPFGPNQICITSFSVERWQVSSGETIDTINWTPSSDGSNCTTVTGDFVVAALAASGNTTINGTAYLRSIGVSVWFPDGSNAASGRNLAFIGIPFESPTFEKGLRNPQYTFSVTPAGGDPASFVNLVDVDYSELPPNGNPYLFPGIKNTLVDIP
jgi:hypothetical protein